VRLKKAKRQRRKERPRPNIDCKKKEEGWKETKEQKMKRKGRGGINIAERGILGSGNRLSKAALKSRTTDVEEGRLIEAPKPQNKMSRHKGRWAKVKRAEGRFSNQKRSRELSRGKPRSRETELSPIKTR
jgi:hypothetical protein